MDGMRPGKVGIGPATCEISYPAAVPAHMRDGIREITRLWVQQGLQRQGHGTELMRELCMQADEHEKVLLVHAEPFRTDMTRDELRAWYERFGFAELPDTPCVMARPPIRRT